MVAFYIMLARPVGRFFKVLRMNFPVMLIAEDICGLRLGLCQYADTGIGLAPLFAGICSTWAIQIQADILPVSLALVLQIRVDIS